MQRESPRPSPWIVWTASVVFLSLGCDSSSGGGGEIVGKGGASAAGGGVGSGGAASSAGAVGSGGTGGHAGGGWAAGGIAATGGLETGGFVGSGGASGGTGGNPDGGSGDGPVDSSSGAGGRAAGGSSSVGGTSGLGGKGGTSSTGGTVAVGGATSVGGSTGAGGSAACTFSDPPANVSAWINESWSAQLGNNVKTRKDWLLDSILMGKGQINLCVRWGASTAPSATVKSGMAAAVQKWFTDWFATLDGYGCFPYPAPVAKVTGWAVKPGNTSWVSDLDASIKVYTETDSDGEPKCPDACSFFTNWTHTFPSCPGGDAYHTDYWLWLDDSIGGGAAAVGGDWGLRMPVGNFTASMGKSNLVIEHEMGHGFGFQDYYDWTGSTPAGGSLMIVGSTSSPTPTVGDQWLLRRTWKEMKTLRGW